MTTSGTRYVCLPPPLPSEQGRHIEVLDFGRGKVRDAIAHGSANDINSANCRWQPVTHPSTISASSDSNSENAFLEPVVSCLPYISTISKEVFDYKAVMADEERIIGLKDEGSSGFDSPTELNNSVGFNNAFEGQTQTFNFNLERSVDHGSEHPPLILLDAQGDIWIVTKGITSISGRST
ncbi:hypothetical protein BDQ17DRAFT_1544383 [Cyathus striatus]|nr:hypothetical protein BDQ17DRAFT_1544383 [Cyathus striatus]